jgi:hypothetical protein
MSDPLGQLRLHFAGLRLREESPQGQVYAGTDINGSEVTIAMLAEALSTHPGSRNAFADVVWRHSVGSEPGRATVYAADLHAPRPWAAIRSRAGQPGAGQLLAALAGAAPTAAVPTASIPPPPPPLGPAVGYPAYPPPAPPSRSRSRWPWVLGGTGAVVAVGLVAVVAVVGLRVLRDGDTDPPVTQPSTPPVETPAATESPAPEPTDEPAGDPTLRDVEPVSLVGPTFDDDEDTYTMAFRGWPFAFRAPKDWSCANGVASSPRIEGDVKACFSLAVEGGVVLWECRADCDEAEQQEKLDIWFADEPNQPVQWDDSPTYYVETEENDEGLYVINLVRFFGTGSGEPRWMVGVAFDSQPEGVEGMQKVVNDILSQTG